MFERSEMFPEQMVFAPVGLVGPVEAVQRWQDGLLQHLNQELVLTYLLGGVLDEGVRSAFDRLKLNAVRAQALPVVTGELGAVGFRDLLEEVSAPVLPLPGVLCVGRDLGNQWPFLVRRVGHLAEAGVMTVADVSEQLALPLPGVFRQFVVHESLSARFGRALERWFRHEAGRYDLEGMGRGWLLVRVR